MEDCGGNIFMDISTSTASVNINSENQRAEARPTAEGTNCYIPFQVILETLISNFSFQPPQVTGIFWSYRKSHLSPGLQTWKDWIRISKFFSWVSSLPPFIKLVPKVQDQTLKIQFVSHAYSFSCSVSGKHSPSTLSLTVSNTNHLCTSLHCAHKRFCL